MKAVYFDGEKVDLREVPKPERIVGEALIRVRYAGICSTDIEIIKGFFNFEGIIGHEFAGTVVECDDPSLENKRVVGEINCSCGECPMCHSGNTRHCQGRSVLGIYMRDGTFAEYITLPEENLHVLPDSIPDEEAALIEPLAAAFRIPEQLHLYPAQKVIVLGDGTMGLLVSMVLQLHNVRVILIGHHSEKLAIAEKMGIPTELEQPKLTYQADVVVDCTGDASGLERALAFVHPEGRIILKTTISEKYTIDLSPITVNEIVVQGSRCGPFPPAIEALAERRLELSQLISRIYPLEEALEAIEYAQEPSSVKVLLKIAGE